MPLCNSETGRREGRLRNRRTVRTGTGTGGIQEQSSAVTKPVAQRWPWGRVWQLPFMLHYTGPYPSAKLPRCGKRYWNFQSSGLFCSSETGWFGDFASFLPTASCIFTLGLWKRLRSCQSRVDPPNISGSSSAAGSPAARLGYDHSGILLHRVS